MKIEFFNNFNNGDIHVSREFIKDIIKKTNSSNVDYFHKNSERILLDIPEIKTQPKINNIDDHISYYKYYDRHPEVFLINTWYNSQPENYKKYSCTLKTLYENFKLIYSELKIPIETEDFYIPFIDFSKYQLPQLLETNQFEKRIFISNCEAISGQSPQIYWDELIFDLTIKFPNYLFFITNPSFVKRNNCIHINKILNEQSIGIEVDNWGPLLQSNGKWYPVKIDETTKKYVPNIKAGEIKNVHIFDKPYRDFYAYEKYTDAQIESVRKLLVYWCEKFNIPKTYNEDMWDVSMNALSSKSGIYSHSSYRLDKHDIAPIPNLVEMLKNL